MNPVKQIVSQIHTTRALQIKLRRVKRGPEKAKVREQLLTHMQKMDIHKYFR